MIQKYSVFQGQNPVFLPVFYKNCMVKPQCGLRGVLLIRGDLMNYATKIHEEKN